jgi:hypothetical protein
MMSTKTKEITTKEPESKPVPKVVDLSPKIALNVLGKMGKPKNLHEVVVRLLYDNRYRVNVWCHVAPDGGSPLYDPKLITDSFFLVADELGNIVRSSPEIKTKYGVNNPLARVTKEEKKKPSIVDIMKV